MAILFARFHYTATLTGIAADSSKGIEQSLLDEVSTCDYITRGYPIIVGPTGTGKKLAVNRTRPSCRSLWL